MIEFEDVWFAYGGSSFALKGISLRFEEGRYYAVIGENGSGKTTLLRHMNGLLKPSRGCVRVDGVDTREKPLHELAKKVAVTFQNPEDMFFSVTLRDEVAFALRNFGYDEGVVESRVRKALSIFGLQGREGESPFSLSEGEKRRLTIGPSLAYGATEIPGLIPANSTLIFEVEIVEIKDVSTE